MIEGCLAFDEGLDRSDLGCKARNKSFKVVFNEIAVAPFWFILQIRLIAVRPAEQTKKAPEIKSNS
jgi:hypothetical protein